MQTGEFKPSVLVGIKFGKKIEDCVKYISPQHFLLLTGDFSCPL